MVGDLRVKRSLVRGSNSAYWTLAVYDPFHEFCRLIDELNPRIFLFENVRGLVTARDASGEPGVIKDSSVPLVK